MRASRVVLLASACWLGCGNEDAAVDTQVADTTPADTTPADTTPDDTTAPVDTAPDDTAAPVDTTRDDTAAPVDTTPDDTTPGDIVTVEPDSDVLPDADVAPPLCPPLETEPCYDGPPGTELHAPCRAGVRTCASDGTRWGPCLDQVVPLAEEVCADGVDDDCDGATDVVADVDGDGFTRCGGGECCEGAAACGLEAGGALPGGGPCDAELALADEDPLAFARALGLCDAGTVVSARWILPDGSAPTPSILAAGFHLGHGLLAAFGANNPPREGERLAALSSGTARAPGDDGYRIPSFERGYSAAQPAAGFPLASPACPNAIPAGPPYDATGIELVLQVPPTATAFAFDLQVFFAEWPSYVCSQFNDHFVVLVDPPPSGTFAGNVAVDGFGAPMNVNSANVRACTCPGGPPCVALGLPFTCALGPDALVGTGFDGLGSGNPTAGGAATGWLTTLAPVTPGSQIRVRMAIYDSSDGLVDATAIVDNWRWLTHDDVAACATPAFAP